MIITFKLKKDAEAFCRELEDKYGASVRVHVYKGHRDYKVQHNTTHSDDTVAVPRTEADD